MTDLDPAPATIATTPLPSSVLTLWRAPAMVIAGLTAAMGAGALLLGETIAGIALLVGAGAVLGVGITIASLRFQSWRWGIDERWIETRRGVVVQTRQVVPRSRVQTVTTTTGPLDRMLGLTTVVVHTAGTHTPNLVVPHVDSDTAAELQHRLAG